MDNNGHGITVRLHDELQHLYNLSGGGLPTTYTATQFHFHWGSVNTQGSEHNVDGTAYPAELHMVHYDKSRYSDVVAALTSLEWNAVAALGAFIEIGEDNNPAFDNFIAYFDQISNYSSGDTSLGIGNLPSFPIRSVFPFDLSRFYRYNGSLTIPNCYESVIWTVFEDTIKISQEQLDKFRTVYGDQKNVNGTDLPIVDNYRLTHPLFDRTIYYSRPSAPAGGDTTPSPGDGGGAVTISPMRALLLIALALHMLFSRF
ncbi:carbonic anhydrase 14-like [Lytechinus pictus]|uniref:carbonic anhydrase 14-like n=1 Tax=Lytechinus pictus TaxID=7653 RepID=UPI0030B9AFD6